MLDYRSVPTFTINFYGKLVGEYTVPIVPVDPMEPMGEINQAITFTHHGLGQADGPGWGCQIGPPRW